MTLARLWRTRMEKRGCTCTCSCKPIPSFYIFPGRAVAHHHPTIWRPRLPSPPPLDLVCLPPCALVMRMAETYPDKKNNDGTTDGTSSKRAPDAKADGGENRLLPAFPRGRGGLPRSHCGPLRHGTLSPRLGAVHGSGCRRIHFSRKK